MPDSAQSEQRHPQGNAESNPESGIVLLMVIFLTFLLLLSLAIAAPEWAHQMQRQRDLETIHRGQQYERAIQLYYRKFNRYPSTVKELLNTNDIRFLRQQYKDPLTGKDDWKLVLYGHAHVHPLGLFGQPLSDLGAVQTSGGMYAISGSSSSGASAPSAASSGMGSSDDMGSSDSMGLGSTNTSGSGSIFGGSTPGSTTMGSTSITGSSNPSSLGSPSSSDSGFQTNAPFVGVVPPIKKPSIVDYRAQDNYSRWEFNYDPAIEQLRAKVSILGGTQNDLNGATSLNGNSTTTSGSPFGSNNGVGSTGVGGNGSGSNGSGSSGPDNPGSLFSPGSSQ